MAGALLSLLGLLLATYLYLFKIGKIGTLACGNGACEIVQLSSYSRFLGIEVALIGVAGYALLLGLNLAALQTTSGSRGWPDRLVLTLAGLGVAFTAYLTYLELFVIHAVCRWCVTSAGLITSLFVISALSWRSGSHTSGRAGVPGR